jgi:hypothetical protein
MREAERANRELRPRDQRVEPLFDLEDVEAVIARSSDGL